jgi:hypothetical protein
MPNRGWNIGVGTLFGVVRLFYVGFDGVLQGQNELLRMLFRMLHSVSAHMIFGKPPRTRPHPIRHFYSLWFLTEFVPINRPQSEHYMRMRAGCSLPDAGL